MDGSATTQATVTLAGTDGVVISDGDTMKQALVSDFGTFVLSDTLDDAVTINESGADKDFRVEASGEASALFVQGSDGFVGIGTAEPGEKLDVVGDIKFGTYNSSATLYFNTGWHDKIHTDGSGMDIHSGASINMYLDANENQPSTYFAISNHDDTPVELFRIEEGGNVGIGTDSPETSFVVYNSNENATQTNFTQALDKAGILIETDYSDDTYTPGIFWSTQNNNPTRPKAGIYLKQDGDAGSYIYMGTSNSWETGITNDAVVIDPSGNVGIGTTGPSSLLEVAGADGTDGGELALTVLNANVGPNDIIGKIVWKAPLEGSPDGLLPGAAIWAEAQASYTASVNKTSLFFGTGNSESALSNKRMTIDEDGNVGIGTDEPDLLLHLNNAYGAEMVLQRTAGSTSGLLGGIHFGNANVDDYLSSIYSYQDGATDSAYLSFHTEATGGSKTEKMRIDSSGNIELNMQTHGSAPSNSNAGGRFEANGNMAIWQSSSGSSTASSNHLEFMNGNGNVGTINTSGSATSYNTSSDYRLKENEVSISDGLERLNQLKPYRFNFIVDADNTVDGFFAHEVSDIVPEAISGEKDAMRDEEVSPAIQAVEAVEGQEEIAWTDKPTEENTKDEIKAWMDSNSLAYNSGDTKADLLDKIPEVQQEFIQSVEAVEAVDAVYESVPDYQGIDQSKLVPLLVAAVQELSAKVEALENK